MISIKSHKVKDFILNSITEFEMLGFSLEQDAAFHEVYSISRLIKVDDSSRQDYRQLQLLRERVDMLCYLMDVTLSPDVSIDYERYKKAVHGGNLIKTWLPELYTKLIMLKNEYCYERIG